MRKFIIVLLLAGAGYYLYTHQEVWKKYNPFAGKTAADNTGMKQTVAWKMITRNGDGSYDIEVLLIDGNRWRIEVKRKGTPRINVAVSDGSRIVASPPTGSVSSLDPRPGVNALISQAAKISDVAQGKSTQATEEHDGHTCWKSSGVFRGATAQFWVDSTSGFPVGCDGVFNGMRVECHILPVDVDLAQGGGEYFNADHTESLMTKELDDDANDAQIAQFSHGSPQSQAIPAAAPAPARQVRYILKDAVSVKSSYGTVTIPAKTEVRIISQTGNLYRVSGGGAEFDVQADQVAIAP